MSDVSSKSFALNLGKKVTGNEMDLSMLNLTEVPINDLVQYCNTMTHLNLSKNQIHDLGLEFAPRFPQITHLDLSHNKLCHLPQNIGDMSKLVHLDLFKNEISRLPISIGNLKKLRWLCVQDNPMVPELSNVCGNCQNEFECQVAAWKVIMFMHDLNRRLQAIEIELMNNQTFQGHVCDATEDLSDKRKSSKPICQVHPPFQKYGIGGSDTSERGQKIGEVEEFQDEDINTNVLDGRSTENLDGAPALEALLDPPFTSNNNHNIRIPKPRKRRRRRGPRNVQRGSGTFLTRSTTLQHVRGREVETVRLSRVDPITKESFWKRYVAQAGKRLIAIILYIVCILNSTLGFGAILFDRPGMEHLIFNKTGLNRDGFATTILNMHEFYQKLLLLRHSSYLPLIKGPVEGQVDFMGPDAESVDVTLINDSMNRVASNQPKL